MPEDTIEQRQQELVKPLTGMGSGDDFKSRAQLEKSAISTLATDMLTTRFQQEHATNPSPRWKRPARANKKRGSTSSSGSKRDFGELMGDMQPQLEEGRMQQEAFQQLMIDQGQQTLAC